MMRTLTAVGAGLGALLLAQAAHAQARGAFGQHGQFIISADRLFPLFSFTHVSQDEFTPPPGNSRRTDTTNQTAISLLWGGVNPITLQNGAEVISPFTVPRVGLDYVIVPHVTIGGDLAFFFTLGGSADQETVNNGGVSTTTSVGSPSILVFGIAPRGGYIWPLTDLFSLWLRGGFSYYLVTSKTTAANATTTQAVNEFALDLDPQLAFTPFPHVGMTVGPTLDIPLAGGHSSTTDMNNRSTTQSAASSILFFGITAGLLAYF